MPPGALPVLDLPTEPYAAGLAHGRAAAEAVAHNLRLYFDRFAREAQLGGEEVRARAAAYLEVIAATAPAYLEGMRGVAAGAGQPLLDIAALNARYELLYSQYAAINQEGQGQERSDPDARDQEAPDPLAQDQAAEARARSGRAPSARTARGPAGECTALAVLPEAARDGHLWLGQNWDWIPGVRGLLLRETAPDGLPVVAFTEAGIVGGKLGMNGAGLGLVINGLLSHQDDWSRLHTPFHVRTHRILRTRTLEAAVAVVTGEARACSANFLLGQADGTARVVDLEAAPSATCTLVPHCGVLAHANHFEDPARLGIWQPLAEERTSTYQRAARMRHLLEAGRRRGTLDREGLMAILRDHEGHPESLCRHPNPAWPEEWRVTTVVSVLMDLTARVMYVAGGPPCEAEYTELSLS